MEGEGETAGLNEVTQTVVDSPWHRTKAGIAMRSIMGC